MYSVARITGVIVPLGTISLAKGRVRNDPAFFFCKLIGSPLHILLNRYASDAGKLELARNHMSSNKDKKMQEMVEWRANDILSWSPIYPTAHAQRRLDLKGWTGKRSMR